MDSESAHRRAIAAFFGDGLWDIALGFGILAFALGAIVDFALLPALLVPTVILVAWLAKMRIAATLRPPIPPLPEPLQGWPMPLWIGAIAIAMLGFLLPVLSMASRNGDSLIRDIRLLPVGTTLAVIVAILGPLCPRWYGYAALIAVVSILNWILELPAWAEFMTTGAIVTASGALVLQTFATAAVDRANETREPSMDTSG